MMHIHWHKKAVNPYAKPEPTDYTPMYQNPYEAFPLECRCGHRRVKQAQPMNGYVGMDRVIGHWLTTGEWVHPKILERRVFDYIASLGPPFSAPKAKP